MIKKFADDTKGLKIIKNVPYKTGTSYRIH